MNSISDFCNKNLNGNEVRRLLCALVHVVVLLFIPPTSARQALLPRPSPISPSLLWLAPTPPFLCFISVNLLAKRSILFKTKLFIILHSHIFCSIFAISLNRFSGDLFRLACCSLGFSLCLFGRAFISLFALECCVCGLFARLFGLGSDSGSDSGFLVRLRVRVHGYDIASGTVRTAALALAIGCAFGFATGHHQSSDDSLSGQLAHCVRFGP